MHPIGIVGSGAMAQALGRALAARQAPVVALGGRDPGRTARAAAFVGPAVQPTTVAGVVQFASHLVIAVSDEAIPAVAGALAQAGLRQGAVVHTCGARGPEALAPLAAAGTACGVLHPLQTVPAMSPASARFEGVTFGIGGDPAAVSWAEALVRLLHGRVLHVRSDAFPAYHAAATLAGNAVAALVDSAIELLGRAGVDPGTALDALAPLCRASLENALTAGPAASLTGPIARGDAATVDAHLRALAPAPAGVAELYVAAGGRLVDLARRRGVSAGALRRIEALLEAARRERDDAARAAATAAR